MDLSEYDFKLPNELVAQEPVHPRDHARLLVYSRENKTIEDDFFYNLPNHLNSKTTLVLNNSKVEKSRLKFNKIEIFITDTHNDRTVTAKVFPGKKFKAGSELVLTESISCTVISIDDEGLRKIEFSRSLNDEEFDEHRQTPFPPYIAQNEELSAEYQTVYADPLGSKAAPTAGLHFTEGLLSKIKQDWPVAELTLHVGLGTFAPLTKDNLKSNKLHQEHLQLDQANADILRDSKHLTAVGTTSLRSLESIVGPNRSFTPISTSTEIFIKPGYKFHATDALITNFHLPKSSLLMLVAAMVGNVELRRIYNHAIANKYRFYSFGDAMIIN